MKKIGIYFVVFILSVVVFLFGFDFGFHKQPYTYYNVYLDDEFIGMIESKSELEDYINNQADDIRENVRKYKSILDAIDTYNTYDISDKLEVYTVGEKVNYLIANKDIYNLTDLDIDNLENYLNENLSTTTQYEIDNMRDYVSTNDIYTHVADVYTPNGIEIKKTYTYNNDIKSVPEIYMEIISKKSCTVAGYMFTIKSNTEGVDDIVVYTLDTQLFNDAIEDLITIFVNEDDYEAYKKNEQKEITTTGTTLENIYVEEEITYKAANISTEEKIYTNSKDLSAYLLRGDKFNESVVQVKAGDSIESIALDNKISVQEFLISNPQYTSRDNLLVIGANVTISNIDPKIHIVVESYEVVDKETSFSTVEQYDENLNQGSIVVSQNGENGLERVSQNVKSINGEISYVDPVDKQVLKSATPKIITIGTKYVPTVGSTASWGWPTDSGYTLSSYYGYRQMVFGSTWHSGLDIAGTGYGSNVYAANNGVIITRECSGSYGCYIIIDHNNGYYTLYGHMSRFSDKFSLGSTVSRGDVIGYVGSTGAATGPHLHYEIRTCEKWSCATNPLSFYR